MDPPIFDESFKRHPTRLLRPLNGTPRQFWNAVPKSTAPGHRVLRVPRLFAGITRGGCHLKEISRPRRGVPFKATTHRRVSFIAENAWLWYHIGESADPRRFRPALGGRFTYPPTPLPPLDPPIFDESFKRHPTRLLRPLNGTPRQFWNVVPKSTTPDAQGPHASPDYLPESLSGGVV